MKTTRLGVGAVAPTISSSSATGGGTTVARMVMNIGKRKRGQPMDGDDSEQDEPTVEEDDDDEDENGRTAIDEKIVTNHVDMKPPTHLIKKKSKKPKDQQPTEDKIAIKDDEMNESPSESMVPSNKSGKRHRKKIRSRQKNIYKDKRPMEQKPAHLQLGGGTSKTTTAKTVEYQGRPITAETREKLNLPPPKERRRPIMSRHQSDDQHGNGGKLGIDDLWNEEDEKRHVKEKKEKKKMARRKPKYKNLP